MRREVVGTVDVERCRELELAITKYECSQQALRTVPAGLTQKETDNYVKSVLDAAGNYQWLARDWWNTVIKEFNLPDNNANVDYLTGEIYYEVD